MNISVCVDDELQDHDYILHERRNVKLSSGKHQVLNCYNAALSGQPTGRSQLKQYIMFHLLTQC